MAGGSPIVSVGAAQAGIEEFTLATTGSSGTLYQVTLASAAGAATSLGKSPRRTLMAAAQTSVQAAKGTRRTVTVALSTSPGLALARALVLTVTCALVSLLSAGRARLVALAAAVSPLPLLSRSVAKSLTLLPSLTWSLSKRCATGLFTPTAAAASLSYLAGRFYYKVLIASTLPLAGLTKMALTGVGAANTAYAGLQKAVSIGLTLAYAVSPWLVAGRVYQQAIAAASACLCAVRKRAGIHAGGAVGAAGAVYKTAQKRLSVRQMALSTRA